MQKRLGYWAQKQYRQSAGVEVNTEETKSISVVTKVVLRRKLNCRNRKSGYRSTGAGVAAIRLKVRLRSSRSKYVSAGLEAEIVWKCT